MISIIIPTYRPQEYIFTCLNSIKSQTIDKKQIELIIVLNGVKEPYYSQLCSYIDEHFEGYNTLMHYTEIGNVSVARNIGLDLANGDAIIFIDDDDYISSNYIETLSGAMKDGAMPICNIISFDDKTREQSPYYIAKALTSTKSKTVYNYRSYFSVIYGKIIDRNIIGQRRFRTNLITGEDSVFMFEISDKIREVGAVCIDAVYYRRMRENSAITKKRPFLYYLQNYYLKTYCVICVWIKHPFNYNLPLFLSRIIAGLKFIIVTLKSRC